MSGPGLSGPVFLVVLLKGMKMKKGKLSEWANEHPAAACFVLVLMFLVFRKGLFLIFRALPQTTGLRVLHELLDVVWPFGMVVLFGKTDAYKRGGFFRTLIAGLGVIILSAVLFAMNVYSLSQEPGLEWYTLPMMALGVFTAFAVGFREESVFRGIAVNLLADKYLKDRRGILITTFAAAAFFGVMHMGNMVNGQSFAESVLQAVNAVFLGAVLVAVYLRGGNLWALMLIHGFYDMAVDVPALLTKTYGADIQTAMGTSKEASEGTGTAGAYVILWTVYLLVTLFLLRRKKCGEIIERYDSYRGN